MKIERIIRDYKRGDVVRVLTPYVGNGRYAPDGFEGIYTVVGTIVGNTAA